MSFLMASIGGGAMVGRVLVFVLWIAGLSLLGYAGYSYLATAGAPAFSVVEPVLRLGDCPAGEEKEVRVRLRNQSGHPIRVVGLAPC